MKYEIVATQVGRNFTNLNIKFKTGKFLKATFGFENMPVRSLCLTITLKDTTQIKYFVEPRKKGLVDIYKVVRGNRQVLQIDEDSIDCLETNDNNVKVIVSPFDQEVVDFINELSWFYNCSN